jgi:Hypothetical glycosyl hydrolase family 15
LILNPRPIARVALLATAVAAALVPVARAAGPEAGSVRLARAAESSFDRYTLSPTPEAQAFMRGRFWRMRTYSPYFDQRLSWYPDAWTYRDLYAIYRGGDTAEEHPEWILRDGAGNKLYIPFDCGGGSCTQYAGDIGDPAFRAYWISAAKEQAAGYRGIFVDDVNLEPRVSDGEGDHRMPFDERTGRPMTEADWRRYVAEFTEQIRAALPGKEVVHNSLWFAGHDDPPVQRQLEAATHVEIERGVNDPGLTGGGGQFGYETLLRHIDWLHARGKGVVLDSYADTRSEVEYELASYFLVSSGRDGLGSSWHTAPGDWWPGYEVRLGAPRGERYEWRGLLRRDFEAGFVLVNQPGRAPAPVDLGPGAFDPAGAPRAAVVLGPAEGAVVTGSPTTSTRQLRGPRRVHTRTLVRPVPNPRLRRHGRSPHRRGAATRLTRGERAGRHQRRLRRAVLVRGRVRPAARRGASPDTARGSRARAIPRRGRVRLRLERRTQTGWTRVRRGRPRIRQTGRFVRLFRDLRPGRYRVVAVYPGSRQARRSRAARGFTLRR